MSVVLFCIIICFYAVAGFYPNCGKFPSPSSLTVFPHSPANYLSSTRLFAKVALTRELGNNEKLGSFLRERNIDFVEIPCIAFGPGEDLKELGGAMLQNDIIVLSSPQAANVFLQCWNEVGRPEVKIATVGKGTSKPLVSSGITPFFEPSDSTAATLSSELPTTYGKKVLYPTSSIAEDVMQNNLEKRGFSVTRLNTYETVEALWSDQEILEAKQCDIVAFASPSAVRTWAGRCGENFVAVTIGPTSAKAAAALNFKKVISPVGSKGVDAWAKLVIDAVESFQFGAC